MTHDLTNFIDTVEAIVASHAQGRPGAYRRRNAHPLEPDRDLGTNPYGCADAINILYTIGRLPPIDERPAWADTLNDLQHPETGEWREATHDRIHTTAHCAAALELLDARPRHPLTSLAPLSEPGAMLQLLEGLDWTNAPWTESHKGAGAYAALAITGQPYREWEDAYFAWLWNETDPETGLWRRGCVASLDEERPGIFPHLAGTFHYLFNLEHARRPLRHPEALVDTCLAVRARGRFPFARMVGFAEVDWVYCLTRALRQCGHRFDEARAALEALAELQAALPGRLRTPRPLRLPLDRRPFI